jgi:hypothetical protein
MVWIILALVALVFLLETVGRRAFEEHLEEIKREMDKEEK